MPEQAPPHIEPPDLFAVPKSWIPKALIIFAVALLGLAGFSVYLHYRLLPFDPVRWQESNGFDRGRMLKSLLQQTDFVGFTRAEVRVYLGPADYDERLFWYDLGPDSGAAPADPRGNVGRSDHLYGVFQQDKAGEITEVLYSHHRPMLGSAPFDSTGWFGDDRSMRRTMFTNALGRLRRLGLTKSTVQNYLGPPDGHRVRAEYDVGFGGAVFGPNKALILTYDDNDVVIASEVVG